MAELPALDVVNLNAGFKNSCTVSSTAAETATTVSAKQESTAAVVAPRFAHPVALAMNVPADPKVLVVVRVASSVHWPLVRLLAWLVVIIVLPAGETTVPEPQPETVQTCKSMFNTEAAALV